MTQDVTCNLCGLTCRVPGDVGEVGGLVGASVSGGYDSTPGNGAGALDDMTTYRFSLCEWCLDWLFSRFAVPVEARDQITEEFESWAPAAERVARDAWRKTRAEFTREESARRAVARGRR